MCVFFARDGLNLAAVATTPWPAIITLTVVDDGVKLYARIKYFPLYSLYNEHLWAFPFFLSFLFGNAVSLPLTVHLSLWLLEISKKQEISACFVDALNQQQQNNKRQQPIGMM